MALVEVRDLYKSFGSGKNSLPAVRGVDLDIERGQTVGLVGESGCGKTTLGRVVVGLQGPTSGQIKFDGEQMAGLLGTTAYRRRVQMVFQHPMQSLNPRYRVGTTLREPLKLLHAAEPSEIDDRVDEVLRLVGLGPAFRNRRPRQLSGGEQQRVAIARALIPQPDLVVLDEPTSSLDQSLRGRIIALLRSIQEERNVAYLFISHDLSTVRRIASVVAVMYLGRIVEVAGTEQVFESPQHPYTKALLSAIPTMDVDGRRERIVLPGETPSPADLPTGCTFQDRCPLVHGRCRTEYPRLESIKDGIAVECFAVQSGIEEPDRPTAGL